MVQEEWTDNMPGEDIPIFSGPITIGLSPTEARLTELSGEGPVHKGLWNSYFESDYNSSCLYGRKIVCFGANSS